MWGTTVPFKVKNKGDQDDRWELVVGGLPLCKFNPLKGI